MSKELIGKNGILVGSNPYFSYLNRKEFISCILHEISSTSYYDAIIKLNSNICRTIHEIYEDLRKNARNIRYIKPESRKILYNEIVSLSKISKIVSGSTGYASDCLKYLSLSSYDTKLYSNVSEEKIEIALKYLKELRLLDYMQNSDKLKKEILLAISLASGNNVVKLNFLKNMIDSYGDRAIKDMYGRYTVNKTNGNLVGKSGTIIASQHYINYIRNCIFYDTAKIKNMSGTPEYDKLLLQSLEHISHTIEHDLDCGIRDGDYITDSTANKLKNLINHIERCGIHCNQLQKKIDDLAWYVGGNPNKIKELQHKLNQLGITGTHGHLKEDGVYGKETFSALTSFLNKLEHGMVPTLAWIDPLQRDRTGYSVKNELGKALRGKIASQFPEVNLPKTFNYSVLLQNIDGKPQRAFMLDKPHFDHGKILGFHMNVGTELPPPLSKYIYNHKPISEKTYLWLKDFQKMGKCVRIGGRILVVMGIALDILELSSSINSDLNDADQKIGKKTVSTIFSIGGRWAGAAAGAKLGAVAGTFAGPAAPVAIPVLSIVGGIAGAFGGDALAQYVVDITYVGE